MVVRKPFREITDLYFENLDTELTLSVHHILKAQAEEILQTTKEKHPEFSMSTAGYEKAVRLTKTINESNLELLKAKNKKMKSNWQLKEIIRFF